jgi:hypothetical protein
LVLRRVNATRLSWALLALLSAGASNVSTAQSLTSATLAGEVRTMNGAPLPDALVTINEAGGGQLRSATTERNGTFSIPLLPAGTYEVLIERLGYRPKRVVGVVVSAGGSVRVHTVVAVAAGNDGGPELEDFSRHLPASVPGLVDRIIGLDRAPELRQDVTDFARRSSAVGADLSGEGLPPSFSGVTWDGLTVWPARHPGHPLAPEWLLVPFVALGTADLVTNGADVEWGSFAGPMISAHSRRGAGKLKARLSGDLTSDALASSKYFDPSTVSASSVQGTGVLTGSLIRDSAEFLVGVDVRRLKEPRPGRWPSTALATSLTDVAQDSFATDLTDYTRTGLAATRSTAAFARFDWRASRNHTVSFRGVATSIGADADALGIGNAGEYAAVTAKDYVAMAGVSSVFSARVWQEFRASYTRSTRIYDAADVPPTRIVDAGLAFGGDPSFDADVKRNTIQLSDALHVTGQQHQLKLGIAVTVPSLDQTFADEATGSFTFAGTSELAARRGVFAQTVGAPPVAQFSVPEFAGFLQDRWAAAPGLDLVAGLRFESVRLPAGEISGHDSLLLVTGIDTRSMPEQLTRAAPRLGLRWDVGGRGAWVVRGGAGVYHAAADPGLLAELVTGDGSVRGRRGVGLLGAWPGVPDSTAAPVLGPRFSVLGPSFATPRTSRFSLGVSRALGGAALHLTGDYRHTDFLTRRGDLNRLAAPAGTDQFGRPLYGTLVQQGSLLAAQGNRRFTSIDRLWALNADGYSDYYGLTVALQREASRGPRFIASYTYSRTTDNWLGGRGGDYADQLNPFPDSVDGRDWADDRSDFDTPHRVVLGVELGLPGPFAPTLSGVFRYESGAPFTPGFRPGVDANGDGADNNDPAFIDDAITGVSALTDVWDCLRTQVDEFAARNSCREPGHYRLDLRLTLQPFRLGTTPVQLVIEGLNLMENDTGLRDHADRQSRVWRRAGAARVRARAPHWPASGRMRRLLLVGGVMLLAVAGAQCDNAGAGNVLSISASGIVKGLVYLDRNGNRVPDGPDTIMRNVRVRLIATGSLDTTVVVLSDSIGRFRVGTVPIGTYSAVVDTTTIGDSVRVIQLTPAQVVVAPGDSVTITATISFPVVSIRAARLLPTGRRVFIEGVLLSPRVVFGDTTGHFADTSMAIRLTRMRSGPVGIGDSLRLLGTTSTRDGQSTFDDAAITPLGAGAGPLPRIVSTLVARAANGGALDAALVFIGNVTIVDTATVPGSGPPPNTVPPNQDYRLTVDSTPADTVGRMEVLLDGHAGFSGAVLTQFRPDSTISVTGVLVPAGAGRWRLKPRILSDVVP